MQVNVVGKEGFSKVPRATTGYFAIYKLLRGSGSGI